jgi:hypothetical protein
MAKEIVLQNGGSALVDDDDYDDLNRWRWYRHPRGYAYRQTKIKGVRATVYMHRIILAAPKGIGVDHIDGDTANNQRSNLRLATQSQNMANGGARKNGSSRYKGVCRRTGETKWTAAIRKDGRSYQIGMFADEVDAARAYDAAAREMFGEFARVNFRD